MKKMLKYSVLAAGTVMLIYVIAMLLVEGFVMGLVPITAFSAVFMIYGIFFGKMKKAAHIAVLSVSLAVLAFAGSLAIYGNVDNVTYNEDVVIVLGKGLDGDRVPPDLANRLDKSVEYHQKNPEALIVVSGGKGKDEKISEALAMKNYLLEKDIPAEKIVMEDKSTSTQENFEFSSVIIEERLGEEYSAAFITNNFHIYRAQKYAEAAGIMPTHLGADIQWYTVPSNYMREMMTVVVLWAKNIV